MNDQDAREYFEEISLVLSDRGLGWIVDHANEAISRGNLIDREVETGEMVRDAFSGQYNVAGKKSKVVMKATVPYSENEQLRMLLDAVEVVAKELGQMEDAVHETLEKLGVQEVAFLDEDSPDPSYIMKSNRSSDHRDWGPSLLKKISRIKDII